MAINQIGIPYQQGFTHTSYLHGAMMAYWLDEKEQKTATKPKFGKITLRLNKLVVLVYSSDELLEDSIVSMQPLLREKAADTIGWKIDEAILRGTGAGQPLGIIVAGNPSKIAQTAEAGQAAGTIVYENIIKMWSRAYATSLRNMIWVANSNTFPQLATMSLAVGTGGSPAYLPANGAAGAPYGTLMGKPIIFSEHCSTVGTEGDICLIDFSQYLVGQKRGAGAGIKFASSIHLKFDYDQTAFRFVMRLDGQPWWPSVFTPKRGSTQSPFITLATRS
jgi:HK97 family phage major capsid protein